MQPYLHMVQRGFWIETLEAAWRRRPVVWLRGVRRSGKTFLCRSLEDAEYLDCELPRDRERLRDPEAFLESMRGRRVVLDEIHRLSDPAEVLKIASDHHPTVRVLATGSSTLEASARFRDKLTGRKWDVWLTPMCSRDLEDFGGSLETRLRRGGMPPFFLDSEEPGREYVEWLDSYWAKDIQDLFRLEKRASFVKLAELVFAQSGGMFDASRFASQCEISRPTVSNYLAALEATMVCHVIRPYSSRKATEIVSAPKVYGFDAGFVRWFRGWDRLRPEDMGTLWEHYVLNEIHARLQREPLYWRDKRGHEVDFVLPGARRSVVAVECKWSAAGLSPAALVAFRGHYPDGENVIVCADVRAPFERRQGSLRLRFCGIAGLGDALLRALGGRAG